MADTLTMSAERVAEVGAMSPRPRLKPGDVATYALLGAGSIVMLLPFAWMVSTSLKSGEATFVTPPQLIPA